MYLESPIWILCVMRLLLLLQKSPLSFAWTLPSPRSQRRSSQALNARYRSRGPPYVESYEEQTLRNLWEGDPFGTAESVVNSVLLDDDLPSSEAMLRKSDMSIQAKKSSFEFMFESLYLESPKLEQYAGVPNHSPIKDKRQHFLIQVAYRGKDFCGWQTQPSNKELPSVQFTLENWLEILEGEKVNVRVCGRTDAGVHAIGQVARYRSRKTDLTLTEVEDHLSRLPFPGRVRCLQVLPVTKAFHPLFVATARAYTYLIDVEQWTRFDEEVVDILHTQLQCLQGCALDFVALSYGRLKTKTSMCTLYHAQAHLVRGVKTGNRAICVELVGDRFLRRMVRMLVETSLRIAVRKEPQPADALLRHLETKDRRLSGPAAPPDGLIFVGATFDVFKNSQGS